MTGISTLEYELLRAEGWQGNEIAVAMPQELQEGIRQARIRAAAPDLLDALHRLMSMAEAHATRKREPIAQAYIDADIAVARAAIAKAEGTP